MLLALAAACSGVHPTPPTGTIVGQMYSTNGAPPQAHPAHPATRPLYGEITIARTNPRIVIAQVMTDPDGRFRVVVPAGSYEVEGTPVGIPTVLHTSVSVPAYGSVTASLAVLPT